MTHDIQPAITPNGPIGVFDSGYGGLTILREIRKRLPEYDYLYLGDNARAPYGPRSFDVIYRYTLEAVEALFARGCRLVILACNTASAEALRSIQQRNLPQLDPSRRVLGVIRPTVEAVERLSHSREVIVLGTSATIASHSYEMELQKCGDFRYFGMACPMWVPLVENFQHQTQGATFFVRRDVQKALAASPKADTIVLACTHYPLLLDKIRRYVPQGVQVVAQGEHVAESLADYLQRHPEMEQTCCKTGKCHFLTTENTQKFEQNAAFFMGVENLRAEHIALPSQEAIQMFHSNSQS